jgi:hypothetical protein
LTKLRIGGTQGDPVLMTEAGDEIEGVTSLSYVGSIAVVRVELADVTLEQRPPSSDDEAAMVEAFRQSAG